MARCAGFKGDGSPCERIVGASQRYCYAHDESKAAERSRNAGKAGRSRPLKELGEVKAQLRALADDVLAGRVDRDDAGVASRTLGVYLRAAEQERKVKELEEVLPRLAEIERRLDQQDGRAAPWR